MNITVARQLLEEALLNGLQLHGVSVTGRPAISFDSSHPGASETRRRLLSMEGLMRDLLRAAIIERCSQEELPQNIASPNAHLLLAEEVSCARVLH